MSTLTLDPETRWRALRRQNAGLRRLRERAGLTQRQVAKQTGMSVGNYRLYERGNQAVTLLHVLAWSAIFGVTPEAMATELGLLAAPRPGEWWGRAELEAEGMPSHEIDRIEATLIDRPLDHQPVVLDVLIRAWRKRQRRRRGRGTTDAGECATG